MKNCLRYFLALLDTVYSGKFPELEGGAKVALVLCLREEARVFKRWLLQDKDAA